MPLVKVAARGHATNEMWADPAWAARERARRNAAGGQEPSIVNHARRPCGRSAGFRLLRRMGGAQRYPSVVGRAQRYPSSSSKNRPHPNPQAGRGSKPDGWSEAIPINRGRSATAAPDTRVRCRLSRAWPSMPEARDARRCRGHPLAPLLLVRRPGDQRPDFDGTVRGRRNPARPFDRLVEVRYLDDVVAAQLFLGLGERAVRGRDLAIACRDDSTETGRATARNWRTPADPARRGRAAASKKKGARQGAQEHC